MTDTANRQSVVSPGLDQGGLPCISSELLWRWLSIELKSPLGPIVSAVKLLRRSRPNETALNERWLEIVHLQSARLVQLAGGHEERCSG